MSDTVCNMDQSTLHALPVVHITHTKPVLKIALSSHNTRMNDVISFCETGAHVWQVIGHGHRRVFSSECNVT